MKKILLVIIALGLSCFFHAQHAATANGEILVQFKKDFTAPMLVAEIEGALGILPRFEMKKCVSDHMRIWLFSFDENAITKNDLLLFIKTIDGVTTAQSNHIISERLVPNDPFFGQQWHHLQSEDHDIDTDLAWDITTGGTTASGDDVVVCVVEIDGAKWDVADIVENHWVNENEIPDNQTDDDENGYVDDYDGWNLSAANDNIGTGDHGTRVNSMIGSTGNDNSGVVGVNWNVKLMQVQMGSVTEANVIEAYTYPLIMRKMYNETGGTKGALVVATNSSWGSDGGQPADAPLWCAMYDSLGAYGVLSCAATTNNNSDVDVAGDLPTGCPSDFLISVARTNNADVRAGGGYGLTTIDLAAPGDNVYLANNTSYTTTTGTSFSSPCVAGAAALLYSAPCNSLMQIVFENPSGAASLVKNYLMDGVDQTTQLQGEILSGGRLNVNNSLMLLMNECDNGSCVAPFAISVVQVAGTLNYTVQWNALASMNSFDVRYRYYNGDWTVVTSVSENFVLIENLLACTEYEVQLLSHCTEGESEWSSSEVFTTDGCCTNPNTFFTNQTGATTATVEWNNVMAATGYQITATANGETIYFNDISSSPYQLSGLSACTLYSIAITSVCVGNVLPPDTFTLHTAGCQACDELSYCTTSAGSSSEYIAHVTAGDLSHTSGNDGGYILVTDATAVFHALSNYQITCVPGFPGTASYNENFRAWIDYNSDGDFDELNELVFDAPAPTQDGTSGNFTVPQNISSGVVRMRVGMRYAGAQFTSEPTNCGTWQYGETEDYCITLDETIFIDEKEHIAPKIFPNPASDFIFIQLPASLLYEKISIEIFDASGSCVIKSKIGNTHSLNVVELASGIYSVVLTSETSCYTSRFMKL